MMGVTTSRYAAPSEPGSRSKKGARRAILLTAPGFSAAKQVAMLPPCDVPTSRTGCGMSRRLSNSASWTL